MAFQGVKILIRGFAERIASSVNDWAFGMKENGASDRTITRRLKEEIETGRIIGEMKRFATAFVPGYVGELTARFGRDTLADRKRAQAIWDAPDGKESDALAALDGINSQGVDTTAAEDIRDDLDIPPDADPDVLYYWVAIHDKNTCDVCDGNSREGAKTLSEWSDIGEPRSGACRGDTNCRCILVPADNLPTGGIPGSIQLPRSIPEPSKL